jgi:hypothetical protein
MDKLRQLRDNLVGAKQVLEEVVRRERRKRDLSVSQTWSNSVLSAWLELCGYVSLGCVAVLADVGRGVRLIGPRCIST